MTEGPAAPTPDDGGPGDGRSLSSLAQDRRLSITALLAIAGLVALAIWLVVESVGDDTPSPTASPTQASEPVAVSADGLGTLAQASGSPIYWVGPRQGTRYEVKQVDGQVYVRYLPSGAQIGDPRGLLTVATYPLENALTVTSGIQGAESIPLAGGGIAVISPDRPNSAYVAYANRDYQIELYHPDAALVRRLATRGAVKPVPAPRAAVTPRGPVAVSQADLVALSKELGQPLYWAGPRGNATYELTLTGDGSVFLRYLRPGTEVGAPAGALTVATYPVTDAYAVTERIATGEAEVPAPGDAVAAKGGTQNNVYLAHPGEDVQIEVYSPVANQAARLVRRGQIVPVG